MAAEYTEIRIFSQPNTNSRLKVPALTNNKLFKNFDIALS